MASSFFNTLAEQLGIDQPEAEHTLQVFIQHVREQLSNADEATLPGIGTLSRSGEGLSFTPHEDLLKAVNHRFSGLETLMVDPTMPFMAEEVTEAPAKTEAAADESEAPAEDEATRALADKTGAASLYAPLPEGLNPPAPGKDLSLQSRSQEQSFSDELEEPADEPDEDDFDTLGYEAGIPYEEDEALEPEATPETEGTYRLITQDDLPDLSALTPDDDATDDEVGAWEDDLEGEGLLASTKVGKDIPDLSALDLSAAEAALDTLDTDDAPLPDVPDLSTLEAAAEPAPSESTPPETPEIPASPEEPLLDLPDAPEMDLSDEEDEAELDAGIWASPNDPDATHPLGPLEPPPFEEADFSIVENEPATASEDKKKAVAAEPDTADVFDFIQFTEKGETPEPAASAEDKAAAEPPEGTSAGPAKVGGDTAAKPAAGAPPSGTGVPAPASKRSETARASRPPVPSKAGTIGRSVPPAKKDEKSASSLPRILIGAAVVVGLLWMGFLIFGGGDDAPDVETPPAVVDNPSTTTPDEPALQEGDPAGADPAGADPAGADPEGAAPDSLTTAVVPPPAPPSILPFKGGIDLDAGGFTLVIGSETLIERLDEVAARYTALDAPIGVLRGQSDGLTRYRLALGQFASLSEANTFRQANVSQLPADAWILRIRPWHALDSEDSE